MKIMITVILTTLLVACQPALAWEQTDFKCMLDCQGAGYSYGYCQKICSY